MGAKVFETSQDPSRDEFLEDQASGYGLIEMPLKPFLKWLTGRRATMRGHREFELAGTGVVNDAAAWLEEITWPATRWIVFEMGAWSCVVTNRRGGSDFADDLGLVRRAQLTRSARVIDRQARRYRTPTGKEGPAGFEARIVEIYDSAGSKQRSIACANDGGRWVYETSGEPFAVESSFDSNARLKRERFTREDLWVLLDSIGAPYLSLNTLLAAVKFSLVTVKRNTVFERTTPRLARDPAFGYLRRAESFAKHGDDYAESVALDVSRSLVLDPSHSERAKPLLDWVGSVLSKQKLDEIRLRAETLEA